MSPGVVEGAMPTNGASVVPAGKGYAAGQRNLPQALVSSTQPIMPKKHSGPTNEVLGGFSTER
jgi:hypothetical protein